MKKKTIWILIIIAGLILLSYSYVKGKYNAFVTLDENVKKQWSQVENVLQRRADLIPNLVSTVKGYAAHEKGIFENVASARARLAGAIGSNDVKGAVAANSQLTGALSRLLAIVENYPDLKANQNFLELQRELAGTENRIAIERKRYNDAVNMYNVMIRRFPNNLFAAMFNFTKNDNYFKAAPGKKEVPKVDFSNAK